MSTNTTQHLHKIFRIRNTNTNEYSRGGQHSEAWLFSKKGKVWSTIGHLKSHLNYYYTDIGSYHGRGVNYLDQRMLEANIFPDYSDPQELFDKYGKGTYRDIPIHWVVEEITIDVINKACEYSEYTAQSIMPEFKK